MTALESLLTSRTLEVVRSQAQEIKTFFMFKNLKENKIKYDDKPKFH